MLGEPEFELRMATWKLLDYTKEGLRFSLTPDGTTTGEAPSEGCEPERVQREGEWEQVAGGVEDQRGEGAVLRAGQDVGVEDLGLAQLAVGAADDADLEAVIPFVLGVVVEIVEGLDDRFER